VRHRDPAVAAALALGPIGLSWSARDVFKNADVLGGEVGPVAELRCGARWAIDRNERRLDLGAIIMRYATQPLPGFSE
jgi:hypothetical protein